MRFVSFETDRCNTLLQFTETFSDSEEDELFAPLVPPPNFTINLLQPIVPYSNLNPADQCLVGKHVVYKWPGDGWYQGQVVEWNSNPTEKIWRKTINFKIYYPCGQDTSSHILYFDSYCSDRNGLASDHS